MGPASIAAAAAPGLQPAEGAGSGAAPFSSSAMTPALTSAAASAGQAGPLEAAASASGGPWQPEKAPMQVQEGAAASGAGSDAENDGGAALNSGAEGAAGAAAAAAAEKGEGVPLGVLLGVPLGPSKSFQVGGWDSGRPCGFVGSEGWRSGGARASQVDRSIGHIRAAYFVLKSSTSHHNDTTEGGRSTAGARISGSSNGSNAQQAARRGEVGV